MGRDTNSRVDQAAVEPSWRERGLSYGLWVDPPGQVWADYVHDTDELVMVVEATSSSKSTAGFAFLLLWVTS